MSQMTIIVSAPAVDDEVALRIKRMVEEGLAETENVSVEMTLRPEFVAPSFTPPPPRV